MKIFGFRIFENDDDVRFDNEIEDSFENEIKFFSNIYNTTSNWTSSFNETVSDTFNSAKEKTEQTYNNSLNFISETSSSISDSTKQNFVVFKDKIGNAYDQFEVTNNFYILLDLISIPILIIGLKKLSVTIPVPQAKIGIIVLIGLLYILEEHKKNVKNSELTAIEINDKTNFEVSKLLKNVDLKSIISTIEPFEKQIPYGKQFFFIVRMFSK